MHLAVYCSPCKLVSDVRASTKTAHDSQTKKTCNCDATLSPMKRGMFNYSCASVKNNEMIIESASDVVSKQFFSYLMK